jgi:uncharacterized delta-60 repeat protein
MERSQVALARYGLDGTLDTLFGMGGRTWASSSEVYNVGLALAIRPTDQTIVVAGYSENDDASGYASADETGGVWRFNADGAIDPTFGTSGWVLDPIISGSYRAFWRGMALQPDGKIICGGTVRISGKTVISYAAIARFWQ